MAFKGFLKCNQVLHPIHPSGTKIGLNGNEVVIQPSHGEHSHAIIAWSPSDNSFVIHDYNTEGGCFINGVQIQNASVRLSIGDVIRIGGQEVNNIYQLHVQAGRPHEPQLLPTRRTNAWVGPQQEVSEITNITPLQTNQTFGSEVTKSTFQAQQTTSELPSLVSSKSSGLITHQQYEARVPSFNNKLSYSSDSTEQIGDKYVTRYSNRHAIGPIAVASSGGSVSAVKYLDQSTYRKIEKEESSLHTLELEAEISKKNDIIRTLRLEIDDLCQKLSHPNVESDIDWQSKVTEKDHEIVMLKNMLELSTTESSEKDVTIETWKAKVEYLTAARKESAELHIDSQTKGDENIESHIDWQSKVTEKDHEIVILKNMFELSTTESSEKDVTIETLKAEVEYLTSARKDSAELHIDSQTKGEENISDEAAELRIEIRRKDAEISSLQSQVEGIDNLVLSNVQADLVHKETECVSLKLELDNIRKNLEDKNCEVEEIKAELSNYKDVLKSKEVLEMIDDHNSQLDSLRETNASILIELETERGNVKLMEQVKSDLEEKLVQVKDELLALQNGSGSALANDFRKEVIQITFSAPGIFVPIDPDSLEDEEIFAIMKQIIDHRTEDQSKIIELKKLWKEEEVRNRDITFGLKKLKRQFNESVLNLSDSGHTVDVLQNQKTKLSSLKVVVSGIEELQSLLIATFESELSWMKEIEFAVKQIPNGNEPTISSDPPWVKINSVVTKIQKLSIENADMSKQIEDIQVEYATKVSELEVQKNAESDVEVPDQSLINLSSNESIDDIHKEELSKYESQIESLKEEFSASSEILKQAHIEEIGLLRSEEAEHWKEIIRTMSTENTEKITLLQTDFESQLVEKEKIIAELQLKVSTMEDIPVKVDEVEIVSNLTDFESQLVEKEKTIAELQLKVSTMEEIPVNVDEVEIVASLNEKEEDMCIDKTSESEAKILYDNALLKNEYEKMIIELKESHSADKSALKESAKVLEDNILSMQQQILQHSVTIVAMEEKLVMLYNEKKKSVNLIEELRGQLDETTSQGKVQSVYHHTAQEFAAIEHMVLLLRKECSELKEVISLKEEIIHGLRCDLGGANAKISDVAGELSEQKKQEFEQNQTIMIDQTSELAKVRKQLAHLSAIVEKQRLDLDDKDNEIQLNKNIADHAVEESNKSKEGLASISKQLTTFRHGSLQDHEGSGKIASELSAMGGKCRGEKHDLVIMRQREALAELRHRIKLLEHHNPRIPTQEQALQQVAFLKHEISDLHQMNSPMKHMNGRAVGSLNYAEDNASGQVNYFERSARVDLAESLEESEKSYLNFVRAVSGLLEVVELRGLRSMGHLPRDEQGKLIADRERDLEQIAGKLRALYARVERKDSLLTNYEKDLGRLREVENIAKQKTQELQQLQADMRLCQEEMNYVQESLRRTNENLDRERRLNNRIKEKKAINTETLNHTGHIQPKHSCATDDSVYSTTRREVHATERMKKRNHEIEDLRAQLQSRDQQVVNLKTKLNNLQSRLSAS